MQTEMAVLGQDATVTYEIDPGCRRSRDCPGYPALAYVYHVRLEDGREIDGEDLPENELAEIEEALLASAAERRLDRC